MKTTKTYENAIKEKYLKNEKSGKLRGNLYDLTPSNIRNVCLNIFDEGLSVNDEMIMKNYFKPKEDENLRRKIENYDLDSFKPISNFLGGFTKHIKSIDAIELIALIIDFKPRPYNKYRTEDSEIEKNQGSGEESSKKKKKDDDPIVILPVDYGNKKGSEEINNESEDIGIVITSNYQKIVMYFKNNAYKTVFSILLIISIIVIISINQQRWMEWQEDHYVEVKFDAEKLSKSILKLYKEERILYFKQITPDCYTKFFKDDGSENLWYGKNATKDLEYFTDLGLHPETGETLKKITKYMIQTHICDTYK